MSVWRLSVIGRVFRLSCSLLISVVCIPRCLMGLFRSPLYCNCPVPIIHKETRLVLVVQRFWPPEVITSPTCYICYIFQLSKENPLIHPHALSAGLVQGGVLLAWTELLLEKTCTSMLQPWLDVGVWTWEVAWADVRRGHSVQRMKLIQVWNNKTEADPQSIVDSQISRLFGVAAGQDTCCLQFECYNVERARWQTEIIIKHLECQLPSYLESELNNSHHSTVQ